MVGIVWLRGFHGAVGTSLGARTDWLAYLIILVVVLVLADGLDLKDNRVKLEKLTVTQSHLDLVSQRFR